MALPLVRLCRLFVEAGDFIANPAHLGFDFVRALLPRFSRPDFFAQSFALCLKLLQTRFPRPSLPVAFEYFIDGCRKPATARAQALFHKVWIFPDQSNVEHERNGRSENGETA
jgi:hypothetical protein